MEFLENSVYLYIFFKRYSTKGNLVGAHITTSCSLVCYTIIKFQSSVGYIRFNLKVIRTVGHRYGKVIHPC